MDSGQIRLGLSNGELAVVAAVADRGRGAERTVGEVFNLDPGRGLVIGLIKLSHRAITGGEQGKKQRVLTKKSDNLKSGRD